MRQHIRWPNGWPLLAPRLIVLISPRQCKCLGWFTFETAVARGKGHLRLKDNRCWTLLTTMAELLAASRPGGSVHPGTVHPVPASVIPPGTLNPSPCPAVPADPAP
jgi:hypothetical protein